MHHDNEPAHALFFVGCYEHDSHPKLPTPCTSHFLTISHSPGWDRGSRVDLFQHWNYPNE